MAAPKIGMLAPRIAKADLRKVKPPAKTADPYYLTPEHRAWRDEVIRRAGGVCQDPAHDGALPRSGVRLFADHIQELRDGGAPLDPGNGMARCGSCHTRKTAVERGRRARR